MRTLLFAGLLALAAPALALEAVFTYQGRLHAGPGPATGPFEFEFELFDDPATGASLAGPVTAGPLQVEGGLFVAEIDFGFNPFAGLESWLEVRVRPGGSSDPFEVLEPRQRMAPAPNALHAEGVALGAVGPQALAPGAVTSAALADGSVGTAKLADGAVTGTKVNLNQIQARIVSGCPPGQAIRIVQGTGETLCQTVTDEIDLRRFIRGTQMTALLPPGVLGERFGYALDHAGRPFISAYDASQGNLIAIHCSVPDCTSFQVHTVDAEGIAGDYSSVGFWGLNGLPVISYWSQTLNALRLATCGDASCATVQSIVTVDSGNVGQWTQLMVLGLDIWIAYRDYGQSQLKLARVASSGTTIRIASATAGDGSHSDMILAPVEGGHDIWIAHGNSLAHSLRLSRCTRVNNTACPTTTVDTGTASAALGRGNAVILGPNGFPVLASVRTNADATHGPVLVYICATMNCTSILATVERAACSNCSSRRRPLLWRGMDGALSFAIGASAYRCANSDCSIINPSNNAELLGDLVGVQLGPDGLPWFAARSNNSAVRLNRCGNRYCSSFRDGRH